MVSPRLSRPYGRSSSCLTRTTADNGIGLRVRYYDLLLGIHEGEQSEPDLALAVTLGGEDELGCVGADVQSNA